MKTLKLEQIRIDGGTQQRGINDEAVEHYAEFMADMPPVEVVYDGKDYWLWNGFHRYHAASRAGLKVLKCEVRDGTKRDAKWLSFSANSTHGIPRTAKERRYIVSQILADPKWAKKSGRAIARHVGVNEKTVRNVKKAGSGAEVPQQKQAANVVNEPAETDESYKQNHRAPEPLTDKTGRAVPDQISEIFLRRGIITKLIQKLDDIDHEIKSRLENKDDVIAWVNLPGLKSDLNNARRNLKAARPHAVCPYCGAENKKCRACKGFGFVGKLVYDQAPAEMKA